MSNPCNDPYTGRDKALHFGVCFVLAIISPTIALLVAIGKEVYDYHQDSNHFCWKDILADAVGVVLGTALHILLRCIF